MKKGLSRFKRMKFHAQTGSTSNAKANNWIILWMKNNKLFAALELMASFFITVSTAVSNVTFPRTRWYFLIKLNLWTKFSSYMDGTCMELSCQKLICSFKNRDKKGLLIKVSINCIEWMSIKKDASLKYWCLEQIVCARTSV